MTDFVFSHAHGRAVQLIDDAAVFELMVLADGVEADGTMRTRATVAELLAHSAEVTNGNYARKPVAPIVTLVGNDAHLQVADVQWSAIAPGDHWAKLVLIADDVPVTAHDCVVVPNGGAIDLVLGDLLVIS